MIKYIDQSYEDLIYYISKDYPSSLNILKKREFVWNGLSFELSIVGASHFLNIDNRLFEVFAAVKLEKYDKLFSYNQLISKKNDIIYHYNDFNYLFKIVDQVPDLDFDLEFNYIFPGKKKPETKLFIKKDNNSILLYTLHSYPNNSKIVYTNTIITKI